MKTAREARLACLSRRLRCPSQTVLMTTSRYIIRQNYRTISRIIHETQKSRDISKPIAEVDQNKIRRHIPTQAPGRNEMRGQNVLRMQFVRCLIWKRRFSCRLPSSSVILMHTFTAYTAVFMPHYYAKLCLQCFDAVGWAAGRAPGQ